jgi:hypothetical protein
MDIYARCGTKVKFGTLNAGYEYQQKDIVKHLKLGEIYTVDHTVVYDSSTEVFFKEAPGISFNSVFFEDTDTGSRIVNFWYKHGTWATETYGAQRDHIGPLKHLAKEAVEAQVIPADPIELADCFMLVLSATRNAGLTLEDLVTAAENKLEINKTRKYPKGVNGEPIEHIREEEPVIQQADLHEDLAALRAHCEEAKHDPDYAVVGLHPYKNCLEPTPAGRDHCDECIKNAMEFVSLRKHMEILRDTKGMVDAAEELLEEGGVLRQINGVFHYVVGPGFPVPDPSLVKLIDACDKRGYFETYTPPYTRESLEQYRAANSNECPHCEREGTLGGPYGYQCKECDGTGEIS